MPSLLVTNDFPPKLGGIQSYLYELWRRLPPGETTVFTTGRAGATAWDAHQQVRVVRARQKVLLPSAALTRDVDALAREVGANVVFIDPMLPLGLIGPRLRSAPYVVVAHGAEITVPASIPGLRARGRRILRGAAAVVAAGGYPARRAMRAAGGELRGVLVPPGVDAARFRPLDDEERSATRARLGLDPTRPLVLGLSRLVPRKGFDVVIDAVAGMAGVQLAIGGSGRDRVRLERRARRHRRARGNPENVRFLGRVPEADLPSVYGCADVFAMCCRDRWAGLEAEGFGIVFLEAAACAVPAVAGRSGGAHEAVVAGETGYVVEPRDVAAVRSALGELCDDPQRRSRMGRAARERAVGEYSYDRLVARLLPIARGDFSVAAILPR
ncbi:MAG: phosphatidyl-myo-inositol dimannoside synthase [Actinomycetota bacterium]|nr:phosphatidyl-myo-inositol dimannoside synthase [Actinomycetota bacterium]